MATHGFVKREQGAVNYDSGALQVAGTNAGRVVLTAELDDVSTASTTYVVCPVAGTVSKIYTVLHGAITVANSALTTSINATAITGGGITVAYSGSAAGDVDSATPTAANTVAAGDTLRLATDGGSTTAARLTVTFVVDL